MSKRKKDKATETVEGRPGPRALTEEEKRSAQLFVPGHSVREPIHDTSGKELMARKGEDTELTTKTRLHRREIPALATLRALVIRINKLQQFCARCGKIGIPTKPGRDDEFKCTHKRIVYKSIKLKDGTWDLKPETIEETITWTPHYWDTFDGAMDEILAGRISLDGKERDEYIKHHEGTQTREKIDRQIGPPSAQEVS